ncbi:MAG: GNAT family N-acetyltransferase [Alphaproteobacteria bacterium]|nr:GNAT family N-acetyltransferase [Alphaproteobacteria bacterium]
MDAPVLAVGPVRLEPFAERHFTPRYVAWLNDPETVRYSEQRHHRRDLAGCRAYVDAMRGGGHLLWAIVAATPEAGHVGNLSAHLDRPNRTADIAILLGEASARRRGFGRAALSAACDWLLGAGGVRKVTAGTMAANAPFCAIARACGMHEEGRRRRHFLLDGDEVDLVMFARFAQPPAASG